jgi:ectoine hydroxylase-related dioxygenase (phytanoyl-CoA dioxygenase family)
MSQTKQLPALCEDYEIDEGTAKQFQRDGHICLEGVATPAIIDAYVPAIRAAVKADGAQAQKAMEERDTYEKAFLQHMNLWQRDEDIARFTQAERFGRIAANLLGVEGVRIYHDQALFKEAGGGFTPWHQDQHYWPLDTDNTVTMWMPLVDITEDMGMLTFASESHVEGYFGVLPISDDSEAILQNYVDEKGYAIARRQAMKAGDATFHYGWTLHSAPGNKSDKMRDVMTIIYVADGTRVAEPANENQENDLGTWLPGLKPGDLVGSALNPLVYSSR